VQHNLRPSGQVAVENVIDPEVTVKNSHTVSMLHKNTQKFNDPIFKLDKSADGTYRMKYQNEF
jgi:hypothetical protein